MGITSVTRLPESQQGKIDGHDEGGKIGFTYSVTFLVQTDNDDDGPQTVLRAKELPWYGDTYEVGTDRDNWAMLGDKTATRVPGERQLWRVVCNYQTIENKGPTKSLARPPDEPSENPLTWAPLYSVSHTTRQKDVQSAQYLGGFKGAADKKARQYGRKVHRRHVLSKGGLRPCNSAFVLIDPALQRTEHNAIVSKTYNTAWYPGVASNCLGSINSGALRVRAPGLSAVFPRHTVLCTEVSANQEYYGYYTFWKVTISVEYSPDGWDEYIKDEGTLLRQQAGDVDMSRRPSRDTGKRKFKLAGDDVPNPPVAQVLDGDGNPVSAPVMFDGDGMPQDNQLWGRPVDVGWRVYPVSNFNVLRF